MKRILNLLFIFFALALSFVLVPNSFHNQPIESIGYIQNVKSETVVLASNNLLGSEIYSQQDEAPSISGCSPCLISYVSKKGILDKNKALLKGSFIHNLSTDNQKVHPIRAP